MPDENDILNDEPETGDDDASSAVATTPEIDYDKLAQHLGPHLRQLAPVVPQRPQPPSRPRSHYEEAVDELKQKGVVNENGLANLDRLLDARERDRQTIDQYARAEQAREHFNAEVNARFDATIDEMAKVMPQLKNKAVRQALKDSAHEIWHDRSEFATEIDRINRGKFPTAEGVKKCVGLAVDDFCAAIGISKPAAPVSLRSSKPDPAPSAATGGGIESLDMAQKRFYNVFKPDLGHEEALKVAKTIKG